MTSTQVDNATFESLWQKISKALVELNIPQNDVDYLKICPLAPEEEILIRVLEDWKLREEECIAQVCSSFGMRYEEMFVLVSRCSNNTRHLIYITSVRHS